jgi:hypothetical protein
MKISATLALLFAALLAIPSNAGASSHHRHSWILGRYHHHPASHHAYVHRSKRHLSYTHHHRTHHAGMRRRAYN